MPSINATVIAPPSITLICLQGPFQGVTHSIYMIKSTNLHSVGWIGNYTINISSNLKDFDFVRFEVGFGGKVRIEWSGIPNMHNFRFTKLYT